MLVSPRYEGPVIITISGEPDDQLLPASRQRRRFESMLETLRVDEWQQPSRCENWSVSDVVAHLIGVNHFWRASITGGLSGAPTRYLVGFDPVTTPDAMVLQMRGLSPTDLLEQFASSSAALMATVSDLSAAQWSLLAEAPPGLLPIRLLLQHSLWDCWIHERDIAIAIGRSPAREDDELRSCATYAAALSPALGMGAGGRFDGSYCLRTRDPDAVFLVVVDDCVQIREVEVETAFPELCGDAVELIEALSLRAPLPDSAPAAWRDLLGGLQTAFDANENH